MLQNSPLTFTTVTSNIGLTVTENDHTHMRKDTHTNRSLPVLISGTEITPSDHPEHQQEEEEEQKNEMVRT